MVVGALFEYCGEKVEVRVQNLNCFFRTSQFQQWATIDGLRLDKVGVIKEFPELKDNKNWKEETIKRFKEKMKILKTESERIKYVIEDLTKFGYKPLFLQRSGYRPIKLY
jgi:hypothetical protein